MAAKLPKLGAHLKHLNCDMTLIATDWFLCLFSTVLPSEVCLHAADNCLLLHHLLSFQLQPVSAGLAVTLQHRRYTSPCS